MVAATPAGCRHRCYSGSCGTRTSRPPWITTPTSTPPWRRRSWEPRRPNVTPDVTLRQRRWKRLRMVSPQQVLGRRVALLRDGDAQRLAAVGELDREVDRHVN